MTIGELIRNARKEKNMTQRKLGELCGINEANIRKYESGRQKPKIETIKKIADALQIPIIALLPGPVAAKMVEYEDIASDIKRDMIDNACTFDEFNEARNTKTSDIQLALLSSDIRQTSIPIHNKIPTSSKEDLQAINIKAAEEPDLESYEVNPFFNYLSSIGYRITFNEDNQTYDLIKHDNLVCALTSSELKRVARSSQATIEAFLKAWEDK
jgi:Predicted transcription factor, homolog of eukaryotic MBF1